MTYGVGDMNGRNDTVSETASFLHRFAQKKDSRQNINFNEHTEQQVGTYDYDYNVGVVVSSSSKESEEEEESVKDSTYYLVRMFRNIVPLMVGSIVDIMAQD